MNSRLQWILTQVTRRLWFRSAIYGLAAIATVLLSALTAHLIPGDMANVIGAEAVGSILTILASSMLAVATFSLGTMVAAFSAAARIATPRASKLLIEDPTSQNALATFLGAFIFSLIGIIVLSTGFYGPEGRVILFGVTIVIVLIIIVTFFRWIDYLSNLSRLGQILEKVESTTSTSLRSRCASPFLGGRPLKQPPDDAVPFVSDTIGYLRLLDIGALDAITAAAGGTIYATKLPGTFVDTARPMAWLTWEPDDAERDALQRAFVIGSERSFDQDPRFGLIALAEIASRALSPGVNDPGTAIDVIGRIVKVLWNWTDPECEEADILHPNVHVPALTVSDLFDDAFGPISRDGADTLEVGIRLQKALATLARFHDDTFTDNARRHAALALDHAEAVLRLEGEKDLLRSLAADVRRG